MTVEQPYEQQETKFYQLTKDIDDHPSDQKPKNEMVSFLKNLGESAMNTTDICIQAQNNLFNSTPFSPSGRVVIEEGINLQRKWLGYVESSVIEKMLIETILLNWLRVNILEQQYTRDSST